MRKLMLLTIGFTIAAAAGAYILSGVGLLIFTLTCLTVGIIFVFLKHKSEWFLRVAVILLGCMLGGAWVLGYQLAYVTPAMEYHDQTVETTITAADYSEQTLYGYSTRGNININGNNYQLRLYTDDIALSPGDEIKGTFTLQCTAADEKNSDRYLRSSGVYFSANIRSIESINTQNRTSFKYFPARLRRQITNAVESTFPADTAGFAKALLLGDSSDLNYKLDTAFKLSGIRHIIAVSGLHVSILFSLMYILAGKRKVLTALLGIPVLFLFAAVAGFSPSIVRACVMQVLMIVAMLLDKEYDPPTALSFAVLLMLAVNPSAVTSVSLQLSVGCMMGIFMFSQPIQNYLLARLGSGKGKSLRAKLARWLSSGISISLSATVFTAPLSAVYFGTFSVLAVATNLLTLWAVSLIFYGIMGSCLLSFIWSAGGKLVAWVISWLMRYVCAVAEAVSSIPIAAVYTCSVFIVFWLIFAYILLGVFLLSKKKRPVAFAVCMILSLFISIAASWLTPKMDSTRATFIDVGQGQSIILQSAGKNYLVDCGGSSNTGAADAVAAQLLSQGITQLDGIIITHYDVDHAGALVNLLTRIQAKALYLPPPDDSLTLDDEIAAMAPEAVQYVSQTMCIQEENLSLSIYAPEKQTSRNESALCVLFQGENCDILITGDRSVSGERALLSQTQLPKVDILVAGHHGAEDSTGIELLHAVRPEVVVICAGRNNRYGHPNAALLNRLRGFGCKIYRTDLQGTVTIRR